MSEENYNPTIPEITENYVCHCPTQCKPGPQLRVCAENRRLEAFTRAREWCFAQLQRAQRALNAPDDIGKKANGPSGSNWYTGEVMDYDAERDEYDLFDGEVSVWTAGAMTRVYHI